VNIFQASPKTVIQVLHYFKHTPTDTHCQTLLDPCQSMLLSIIKSLNLKYDLIRNFKRKLIAPMLSIHSYRLTILRELYRFIPVQNFRVKSLNGPGLLKKRQNIETTVMNKLRAGGFKQAFPVTTRYDMTSGISNFHSAVVERE